MPTYKSHTKEYFERVLKHIVQKGPYKKVVVVGDNSKKVVAYAKEQEDALILSVDSNAAIPAGAELDLCINAKGRTRRRQVLNIDTSEFQSQFNFYLKTRDLSKYSSGLLHLKSPAIACLHIAISLDISDVEFCGVDLQALHGKSKLPTELYKKIVKANPRLNVEHKFAEDDPLPKKNEETETEFRKYSNVVPNSINGLLDDPYSIFDNQHVNFDLKSAETCAIVGNSGKLLQEEHGEFIDSHDIVIRFNAAPTKNFEQFVGSRTDFRFINLAIQRQKMPSYVETSNDWITTVEGERLILKPSSDKYMLEAATYAGNKNEMYFLSETSLQIMGNATQRYAISHPSLGIYGIFIFLRVVPTVNVFGFGFHQEDLNNRHYFEKFSAKNKKGGHKFEREKKTLELFDNKEILKIY